MAGRTLFYLGDMTNRCIFSNVQCYKPKLYTHHISKQVRSFRKLRLQTKKVEKPTIVSHVDSGSKSLSKLWKPFCFTVVFSGTTFAAAAIWEYEHVRKETYKLLNRFRKFKVQRTGWRHEMEIWWKSLTEGQKVFAGICFLNVLVFLAWKIPAFQQVMNQYFSTSVTSSSVCWPMLLSTFSHYSLLHLAANMYVLHSFSSVAVTALGKEHFLAFYLSSGVISSFTSYLYKASLGISAPSLGASGAVMAVLGFVCNQFPDIHLTLIFLPMYTFAAGTAIKAVIAFDITGCILRWRFLDHAAHLGGVLFGMFWQSWGNANLWQQRQPLLQFWHELRGPSKS